MSINDYWQKTLAYFGMADDGYDDLQSTMAKYFRAPWQHPPTVSTSTNETDAVTSAA